jgi:thymidylate kinase
VLISFSGLDGSGKSTLSAWLRTALVESGHRVTVLHMNDDVGVYAYLRRLRDFLTRSRARAAVRSQAVKVPRGRLRQAIVWSRTLRWCIYPLDLLIFALYRIYVEKLSKRVLLMDRYFYDTLVDLSRRSQRGNRLLELLTPVPDLAVLVDVPPEHAVVRKREYPLEYLSERWPAYQAVFSRVPGCVRVPNSEPESARRLLWRVVKARMPGPPRQRSRWLPGLDRLGGGSL